MALEADVLKELRRLRTRVPLLTGALAASADGLVLARDVQSVEAEGLSALTAAALGVAHRMTDIAGRGHFRELLVRGSEGYVATYAAGPSAVLTLIADEHANVGRLHLEGRRSGARIAELVAAGLDNGDARAAASTGGPGASAPPGRSLGTLPVRMPGEPRRPLQPGAGN
ncbi:roadblock/LC7 domain-containing protein [Streptomyces sp. MS06]|uniref:roadblock/LC7 domain-containing protein n=1 Tax=Streptomyces sp. MS06 TaxID=3385974 RepID=UPI00399FB8AA